MILIDSNILLDITGGTPDWVDWSVARLAEWSSRGAVLINDVIYAEVSVGFRDPVAMDGFLRTAGIVVERTPREALFLAARAHLDFRRRGGTRSGVLPDFFVGAHAAVAGLSLLTRDPRRYRTYFPTLDLISPA